MTEATNQITRKRILIGAILWILCLQFFIFERIVAARYFPSYNFNHQLISDLGDTTCSLNISPIICSQRHVLMNLSFLIQGVLMCAGALLVRRAFTSRIAFNVATGALLASGVGVFWMGAAPADIATQLHNIVMNLYLLAGGLGVLIFAVMLFTVPGEMPILGIISIVTGGAIFLGSVLTATNGGRSVERLGMPQGFAQRLAGYGIPIWLAIMGIGLLLRRGREAPPVPGIYLPPPPPPRMRDDR